jgi:hypothetical protein
MYGVKAVLLAVFFGPLPPFGMALLGYEGQQGAQRHPEHDQPDRQRSFHSWAA